MYRAFKHAIKRVVSRAVKIPFNDQAMFWGEVCMEAKDRHGKVFFEFEDKNVLLRVGKYKIMDILRDSQAEKEIGGAVMSISRFSVGDGGAASSSLNTPKALDDERTGLYNEVHRKDITSHSKVTPNGIEFIVDVLSDDMSPSDFNAANGGEFVNEAGLVLSVSGQFSSGHPSSLGVSDPAEISLSHKTHKSVPVTPGSGTTLSYRWKIFTRI